MGMKLSEENKGQSSVTTNSNIKGGIPHSIEIDRKTEQRSCIRERKWVMLTKGTIQYLYYRIVQGCVSITCVW